MNSLLSGDDMVENEEEGVGRKGKKFVKDAPLISSLVMHDPSGYGLSRG